MTKAYLEITMKVAAQDRPNAGAVYTRYLRQFLTTVPGARTKDLLLRDEDVQVLHGFDSRVSAQNYLTSALFVTDVVGALTPFLKADPDIRIYDCH